MAQAQSKQLAVWIKCTILPRMTSPRYKNTLEKIKDVKIYIKSKSLDFRLFVLDFRIFSLDFRLFVLVKFIECSVPA